MQETDNKINLTGINAKRIETLVEDVFAIGFLLSLKSYHPIKVD